MSGDASECVAAMNYNKPLLNRNNIFVSNNSRRFSSGSETLHGLRRSSSIELQLVYASSQFPFEEPPAPCERYHNFA
jgi:hypothetical protein